MPRFHQLLGRADALQRRHPVIGFPIAVLIKFGDDQATSKAIVLAYNGLFALFPLLLLFSTVLGFVLRGDPHLRAQILGSALAKLPILGAQVRSHALGGSSLALGIGVAGLLYGTQGIGQAALAAMNGIWNVPYVEWPNFWKKRLRGLASLSAFGVALVAATVWADLGHLWIHGPVATAATVAGSLAIDVGSLAIVFLVLTSEPLRLRDVLVGAALAGAFWELLQLAGSWYVGHVVTRDSATYGFFAIVIGLVSWVYLGAQLTLAAAEVNVVRRDRLWPRSLARTGLTEADRRVYERLARMQTRRPGVSVEVRFDEDAASSPASPR